MPENLRVMSKVMEQLDRHIVNLMERICEPIFGGKPIEICNLCDLSMAPSFMKPNKADKGIDNAHILCSVCVCVCVCVCLYNRVVCL